MQPPYSSRPQEKCCKSEQPDPSREKDGCMKGAVTALKLFGYKVKQSQKAIVTRNGNGHLEFVSSIEDIDPKGIYITVPLHNQVPMEVKRGENVNIRIPMHSFVMEITGPVSSFSMDNIPLLVIEHPGGYRRIQRRNSVRMKVLMDVEIAMPPDDTAEEPAFTNAMALDISAGGMEVLVSGQYEKNAVLLIKFELPVNKKTIYKFLAKSQIRRVTPVTNKKNKLGLQFINMARSDADKIFQFIFKSTAEKNLWKK